MPNSLQSQLKELHQIFIEAQPTDPKTVRDYAWTVAKQLNANAKEVDSLTCRQLLADCIKLPVDCPSNLYSALLNAAVKVAGLYPEFRFAAFLRMWGLQHFRPEDKEQRHIDGKSFPSLWERSAKALGLAMTLHPQDRALLGEADFEAFLSGEVFSVQTLLVTRIKEAMGKDGRKLFFVTLTSPQGVEVECVSNQLLPHPMRPLPEGKRHYANVGHLYDCLLRLKPEQSALGPGIQSAEPRLTAAFLSPLNVQDVFSSELGFIESIDPNHRQMHVYDRFSRHFVAPILRFSREQIGDFVRFVPIVPLTSKFKTAIILGTVIGSALSAMTEEAPSIIRQIRITSINAERHFASWELVDKDYPVTEQLSPLQLSQGETSPSFTSGFLSLTDDNRLPFPLVTGGPATPLVVGQEVKAVTYLKRGKDKQKRPHIARIYYAQ